MVVIKMTMHKIFNKLRKNNKSHYTQFIFCITFAIMLITSFALILLSPVTEAALPTGGDSRKQVYMIFAVALIGCLIFVFYAAGLFFKYKSRETGVLLALGANKKQLENALFVEIISLFGFCIATALILATIVSFSIWQVFRLLLGESGQAKYQASIVGYVTGFVFAVVLLAGVAVLAWKFMKRTNLIDILNEQRKSEPLKMISKFYGVIGGVFLLLGIFLGYIVPMVAGDIFHKRLPGIWSLTYIFSVIGIYMVMVFAIAYHKRGKRPEKYYKNIISYGMMKFQGQQTVRNMCVISLLVACSLFACFYAPSLISGMFSFKNSSIDFSIPVRESAPSIVNSEIYALAEKNGIKITKYNEVMFSELAGSGIVRDWSDEGNLTEEYLEHKNYFEFTNESQFNQSTNGSTKVEEGTYQVITAQDETEQFWVKPDDLDKVSNIESGEILELEFAGTVEYQPLVRNGVTRYILNDKDYEEISRQLSENRKIKQIIFNVEAPSEAYEFSKQLYQIIVGRSNSMDLNVMSGYNEFEKMRYQEEGREYFADERMEMNTNNPDLMEYWKFYPVMKILVEKTYINNFIIFFILFLYVAVICMAAVGIISYTRSITIGLNNKSLFWDLQRLGANHNYIIGCVTKQLNKIFILPTAVGIVLMSVVELMILVGNDGRLTQSELWVLGIDGLIIIALCIYQFIIYKMSLKKLKYIIGV